VERFVQGFLRSSLVWLGIGVAMGVAMAFWPPAVAFRPAHMHANLLGFVSMMIFGVAYHVVPRFTSAALHSRRTASIHLVVANAGLALQVTGWMLAPYLSWSIAPLRTGAALSATGALLFIYNIWRTIDAAPTGQVVGLQAPAARPPVAIVRNRGGAR
jgi:cbb3-type cytochrome oxidase subunit 1